MVQPGYTSDFLELPAAWVSLIFVSCVFQLRASNAPPELPCIFGSWFRQLQSSTESRPHDSNGEDPHHYRGLKPGENVCEVGSPLIGFWWYFYVSHLIIPSKNHLSNTDCKKTHKMIV